LSSHKNWVRQGIFSNDNRVIISCSDDKTIKIWDSINNKLIYTYNDIG